MQPIWNFERTLISFNICFHTYLDRNDRWAGNAAATTKAHESHQKPIVFANAKRIISLCSEIMNAIRLSEQVKTAHKMQWTSVTAKHATLIGFMQLPFRTPLKCVRFMHLSRWPCIYVSIWLYLFGGFESHFSVLLKMWLNSGWTEWENDNIDKSSKTIW